MWKVAIGCDPNAVEYKKKLIYALEKAGYEVCDFGSADPIYANVAIAVGEAISGGSYDRGILICGTGIGVSVAANKVSGIRAALVTDCYSAERARKSNDAQIACFGAFTIGYSLMEKLTMIFLNSEFESQSPSAPKVVRILEYENIHK